MRFVILAAAAAAVLLLQVSASGATRTEALVGGSPEALVGGWRPIKNLSDPYVRGIAEFAIKAHNDEANTGLVLVKVMKGETQVVSGANYRLVVEVKDGADTKSFEVVVWDKPWEHSRRLTSFTAVPGKA